MGGSRSATSEEGVSLLWEAQACREACSIITGHDHLRRGHFLHQVSLGGRLATHTHTRTHTHTYTHTQTNTHTHTHTHTRMDIHTHKQTNQPSNLPSQHQAYTRTKVKPHTHTHKHEQTQ